MGSAILSACKAYRYSLSRDICNTGGMVIAYIGINPSTADADIDDHTVRKWFGFAERNNAKRFIVGNAFALRSTDVKGLLDSEDPIGVDNDKYLSKIIEEADLLVPCWGSRRKTPNALHQRFDDILSMLASSGKPVMCLGTTKSGDPKHPLMLPYSTELVPYDCR